MGKHSELVRLLADRLNARGLYSRVRTNVYYETPTKRGELDDLAEHPRAYILIEVKSNNRTKNIRKARSQLERAVEHCPTIKNQRVWTFIAWWEDYDERRYGIRWYDAGGGT